MPSAKRWPFCLGLSVLNGTQLVSQAISSHIAANTQGSMSPGSLCRDYYPGTLFCSLYISMKIGQL